MAVLTGTAGDDKLVGGNNTDRVDVSQGGHDTVAAGAGDDFVFMGATLGAGDRISGGTGQDQVLISGDYSRGLNINPTMLSGVETLQLADNGAYHLTFADGDYQLDTRFIEITGASGVPTANAAEQIDASAVSSIFFVMYGSDGSDVLTGGALGDSFISGGGADTAVGGGGADQATLSTGAGTLDFSGGDGDDTATFYDALKAGDRFDGGAGKDTLYLVTAVDGSLSGAQIHGVETIVLDPYHADTVRLDDSLATSDLDGGLLRVIGGNSSDAVVIDGSAELDTALSLQGGAGDDVLTGGARNDILDLSWIGSTSGGADHASGGAGDDRFIFGLGDFDAGDRIDGGAGNDVVVVLGSAGRIVLAADSLVSIETIEVTYASQLVLNDAAVAARQVMLIDGSGIVTKAYGPMLIDGSAETNGRFDMIGTVNGDTLTGGAGADTLFGGGGRDVLTGGGGVDHFVYSRLNDSTTNAKADLIQDLTSKDVIDLSGIDARSDQAGDQAFVLVKAFDGHAGEAMLLYDRTTSLTALSLDVDGDRAADARIDIAGAHAGFDNFVL